MQRRMTGVKAVATAAFLMALGAAGCGDDDPSPPCGGDCVVRVQRALDTTLEPVADAHVREGSPTTNFGTAATLEVKTQTGSGNTRWAYLRFPLGAVGGPVTAARLRLHGSRPSANPATNSVFAVASNGWTEAGINWSNRPPVGARQGTGVVIGATAQYYEWDVTAFVAAQKSAGQTEVSLAMQMDASVTIGPDLFSSRQAASNRPQLVVTTASGNQAPTVAITQPANGASFIAPASITVGATAADADGTVARVELTRNGELVGSATTAPYAFSLSNLGAGTYLLRATAFDNLDASASAEVTVTVSAAPAGSVFIQDPGFDGLVSIEAEHFGGKAAQGGRDWSPVTPAGSSGTALQALPNSGANVDTGYLTGSPRLDFDVHFYKTGPHYVWTRGIGPTTSDDSYHAGLDGQAVASGERIAGFTPSYSWRRTNTAGGLVSLNVASAGRHTVNAWMREDGLIIDKIVLTTNPAYVPTGSGPAESARTGGNLPPVADAGAGCFGLSGRAVTLDGTRSRDPDGGPAALSYTWTQVSGPAVTLTGASTPSASFAAAAGGSYGFQLRVFDGANEQTDTITCGVTGSAPGPANLADASFFHDAQESRFGNFPAGLFDGDPVSLGLANYVDAPVRITVVFPRPVKVTGAGGVFHDAGNWTLEAATNLNDLGAAAGSYRKLVNAEPHVPDGWSRRTFAEGTFQVFRFTDDRTGGDGFVHVKELELTLANRWDTHPMRAPRGVAVNGANQRLVADPTAGRVFVFDAAGGFLGELGQGRLSNPYDVAIDAYQNILVADFGANSVLRFDRGGTFLNAVASAGTGPGQVSGPSGLAVDDRGRILISEVTSRRVQRLLPTGAVDTSFGTGGVFGTGVKTRANNGFDQPMDVAWDQGRRQVVVADKGSNDRAGNNRLQILSETGSYLRTVSAVYDVQSLAVAGDGTIYAGGGVIPVNGTPGALRIVRPGDELVREYFRNGQAGLGQSCNGLAWDTQGKLVISDQQKRLLHTFEPGKQGDLYAVSTRTGPDWIEISYRTHLPAPTVVHWGPGSLTATNQDPTPTTNHVLRITGRTPNTRYVMVPVYPRSLDGAQALGRPELVVTEPAAGQINVMRLETAVVIYRWNMTDAKVAQLRSSFDWLREFYFRNSHGRLWLATKVIVITRTLTSGEMDANGPKPSIVQTDLQGNGYTTANRPDLVIAAHHMNAGNFGGLAGFFGRDAGYARFSTESPFVIIHEANHSLDSLFDLAGMPHYDFNHGLWFVNPVLKGLDGGVNGEITRRMSAANVLALWPRWGQLKAVPDADGDGLSTDTTLPVHEAGLGGDPAQPDGDQDGLTDLQEMERGVFHGTRPGLADGDGDAATQGDDRRDRNPLLAMNAYVARGTPTIDGSFSAGEGWTPVMSGVNFQNVFSMHSTADPRDTQLHPNTKVWSAWDDQAIYFALEFTDRAAALDKLFLRTDLSDQGWFQGLDKHYLTFDNGRVVDNLIHGMTQDISNIVGNGEWATLFDHHPEWKDADKMALAPLFDRAQLVPRVTTLPGERYYVELRIPAGARRSFLPSSGKPVNFMVYHETTGDLYDPLMEMDTGARLLLVDRRDSDGDGLWDQQEADIGRDPLLAE